MLYVCDKGRYIELGDFLFAKQIQKEIPEALKDEKFTNKDDEELIQACEEWVELETDAAFKFFESQSDWCFIYNNNAPTTTKDLSKADKALEKSIESLKQDEQNENTRLKILKTTFKLQTIKRILDSRGRVPGKIIVFPGTPQPPVASGFKFNFFKNHR